MAKTFGVQIPNDKVRVERDGIIYIDTQANFELDAGFTLPVWPAQLKSIWYDQDDGRVVAKSLSDQQKEINVSTTKMDSAIANVDDLVIAQQARQPEDPQGPPPGSTADWLLQMNNQLADALNRLAAAEATIVDLQARVTALETP